MAILRRNYSRELIALSYKKICEHRMRKHEQIKSTAHDENHTEINKPCVNRRRQSMKQKAFESYKKHCANKQHYTMQQTTLSKQALHTALFTTAIK